MISSEKNFEDILSELHDGGLEPVVIRPPAHEENLFSAVTADSRLLKKGSIFCAIKGQNRDGHDFIQQLLDSRNLAIVEDAVHIPPHATVAVIRVSSTRAAWAQLASFFCGHPHKKLHLIGITGTNGKTSTVWMIHELLLTAGIRSASIGTLGFFLGREQRDAIHTTPDPDVLYPFLGELVTKGYSHVTMEVSSHSLVQGKLHPMQFDVAGFTSFSQDHLDFHGTMGSYLDAKCLLFDKHLKTSGHSIFHESLLSLGPIRQRQDRLATRFSSYGCGPDVNVKVVAESNLSTGTSQLQITAPSNKKHDFSIPMIGGVFSENFVCALIAASCALNHDLDSFCSLIGTSQIRPVPGRLEPIHSKQTPCRPMVYVDYAHTPDALEKTLSTLTAAHGRIITVFGCGGDRDKSKRPLMGAIAAKMSDLVFVTSDNPRNEDASQIIADIMSGTGTQKHVVSCLERGAAIELAVNAAQCSDIILIAGKGHENYQQIGDIKHPFSDQKVARIALEKKLRWLILGAGQSGFAAMRYLLQKDQVVTLTDDNPASFTNAVTAASLGVQVDAVKMEEFDKLVISPGVPFDHHLAVSAKARGLEILTEIDLGLSGFRGDVIGVTGTNGKSTTVAMIEFALKTLGHTAAACGNIGIPPTTLDLENEDAIFTPVLELSSYQLEGCLRYPAKGIAITSFSNDHLARHKTMKSYFLTKWFLTTWPTSKGLVVLSRDVAEIAQTMGEEWQLKWPEVKTIVIDGSNRSPLSLPEHVTIIKLIGSKATALDTYLDFEKLNILGIHNQMNALTAALLVQTVAKELPLSLILETIAKCKALPFRCELVLEQDGIKIINDSKSTNLESTLAALSMAQRPAILLMGGQGKGEPYGALEGAKDRIKFLFTFGASGAKIAEDAPGTMKKQIFIKMEDAVLKALQLAAESKCDIIFSPGCASFDEFHNFEHRGQTFNQLVDLHMKGLRPTGR
jgi:UDP-N-acetylmuramoyl-L-alanyl-D-glutamate--2,6-diaminopimelate ligase